MTHHQNMQEYIHENTKKKKSLFFVYLIFSPADCTYLSCCCLIKKISIIYSNYEARACRTFINAIQNAHIFQFVRMHRFSSFFFNPSNYVRLK